MALPSLHPCEPSPIAPQVDVAGDKLPGTHRSQPCPREASYRSPSCSARDCKCCSSVLWTARAPCLPWGLRSWRRASSWSQGQLKLSRWGTGRNQEEWGLPDALGTAEGLAITRTSVGHPWVTEPEVAGCHMGSLHARARALGRSRRPPALPSPALTRVTNTARCRAGTRLKQVREVKTERRECENRFSWKSEGNVSMVKKKKKELKKEKQLC